MARFTHPAITLTGTNAGGEWDLQGGTTGAGAIQPTFDGEPLFVGEFVLVDPLCHFDIEVDFDNITSFGTGQYYMTLPFTAKHDYAINGGRLHDISNGDFYTITGEIDAGSNIMKLFSVGSNGRGVVFDDKTPITLETSDRFHIGGTYEIVRF